MLEGIAKKCIVLALPTINGEPPSEVYVARFARSIDSLLW